MQIKFLRNVVICFVLIMLLSPICPAAVRIMPLGDSITEGVSGSSDGTGYRRALYLSLANAGYAVDFVGSCSNGTPIDFDRDHEGHGGWRANQIRDSITGWLISTPADVILLHIGTNDIWHDAQLPSGIAGEINQILDKIDDYETNYGNPITVVLAQIINRSPDSPAAALQDTIALNNEIASLYQTRVAAGDNLVLVDMYHALNYPSDLADSAHPNNSGYAKMAAVWSAALDPFMVFSASDVRLNSTALSDTTNADLNCSYTIGGTTTTSATTWYKSGNPIMNLYLPMEGGEANALVDNSGNSVSCVASGNITWSATSGYNGFGALSFDGTCYINAGESFPAGNSYTKTAWIKRTGDAGNIISGDSSLNSHVFCLSNNILSAGHDGIWDSVQDTSALSENIWYFVAVTYNATNNEMILYKNGIEIDRETVSSNVTDTTALIGSYNFGQQWLGSIDDARIYNCDLSKEQITAMYNNGSGNNNTIVSQETSVGDTWQASVTPFLPTKKGLTVNTNIITITVDNGADISNLKIASASEQNLNSEDILCSYSLSEVAITSATAWFKSGTPIMNLYLPMEGGAVTALNNYAGSGGVCVGYGNPVWSATAGHDGHGGFVFDGVNDYISGGNNFPANSSYTKSAWVFRTTNSGNNNIISGNESSGGHAFWAPESGGNKLSAGHNNSWTIVQDPVRMELNTWYFVSVTFDATTGVMSLYKNGVLVDTGTSANNVTDKTVLVGSHHCVSLWTGVIDDARVYNYALTGEQIAAMYNSGNGNGNIMVSQETSIGDSWQAQVVPFSNTRAGSFTISNTIAICPRIFGYIKNKAGTPIDGVTVTADNGNWTGVTDLNGYYQISVPYQWSGTVTAVKEGYAFISPAFTLPVVKDQSGKFIALIDADIDGSNYVDMPDLAILAQNWLNVVTADYRPDFDRSGTVDLQDFAILSTNWMAGKYQPSSLIGYWKLDEANGNTAIDASEYSNDGMVIGSPVRQAGMIDGGYLFNGTSDYILVEGCKGVGGHNPRTVTAFIKANEDLANNDKTIRPIVSWGDTEGSCHKWLVMLDDATGKLALALYGARIKGGADLEDGQWHHIAVVLPDGATNTNEVIMYVDGEVIATNASSSSAVIDTRLTELIIGGNDKAYTNAPARNVDMCFAGVIDEVRIYSRALSQQEIYDMAN